MTDILPFYSPEDRLMSRLSPKADILGMTRIVLLRMAAWTTTIYDADAGSRLVGLPHLDRWDPNLELKQYLTPNSAGLQIESSRVLQHVDRIYDLVASGEWRGSADDLFRTWLDTRPFHRLLMDSDALRDEMDEPTPLPEEFVQPVLRVMTAFHGRNELQLGRPMTLDVVAALAGLSEKTVRMAAVGRDRNPDLATFKEHGRTLVAATEAVRWLSTKRYRPTVFVDNTKLKGGPPPETLQELAGYLRALRESAGLTVEDVGRRLNWSHAASTAYGQLEAGVTADTAGLKMLTIDDLDRLARILSPDDRVEFVRAVGRLLLLAQLESQLAERFPLEH